jgi:transcriptional regulator with XRE-family HTH domain
VVAAVATNEIGRKIKELRVARGMNMSELARRVGVTPPSVHNWQKGVARPSPDKLASLAKALGVSEEFLRDDRQASSPIPDSATLSRIGQVTFDDVTKAAEKTVEVAREFAKIRGSLQANVKLTLQVGDLKLEIA